MTYLLDINALVALFDAAHVYHDPAHRWFAATGKSAWATCPLTENGFVRVISNPRYAATPADALLRLRAFCANPELEFWPDTPSITDPALFDLTKLQGHQQITDLYLAGLAMQHGGRLATFDSSIPFAALVNPPVGLIELIPSA